MIRRNKFTKGLAALLTAAMVLSGGGTVTCFGEGIDGSAIASTIEENDPLTAEKSGQVNEVFTDLTADQAAASIDGQEDITQELDVTNLVLETPDEETVSGHETGLVEYENEPEAVLPTASSSFAENLMTTSLEATYDLRNTTGALPAVRNQGRYGLCWDFAMTAVMEINLIHTGQATNSINLAELQTAYYNSYSGTDASWSDPVGGLLGDGYWCTFTTDYSGNGFLALGGNQLQASLVMADWKGLTQETSSNNWEYNTTNGNKLLTAVANSGSGYKKEKAYQESTAHLTSMRVIPISTSSADMQAVKQAIKDYGAVSISYRANVSGAYNSSTAAYYCSSSGSTNHAITVVGWDDTYSKSNFASQPSGDGAWICRNSWGSSWGDKGYFYLSYYDATIGSNAYTGTASLTTSDYDNNYQYDGGRNYAYFSRSGAANVFTTTSAQALKAVYFETLSAACTYTVSVYTGLTSASNPESGTLAETVTGSIDYMGFYRIELPQTVYLESGTKFSVVVRLKYKSTSSENPKFILDYENSNGESYSDSDGVYTRTEDNSLTQGQSFIYSSSGWCDVATYYNAGNIHIKAFTDDVTEEEVARQTVDVTNVTLSQSSLTLDKGKTATLTAYITPSNATNQSLSWSSADSTIAEVASDGTVTGMGPGTTTITVTDYKGRYSATCQVRVNSPVTSVKISLTGSSTTLYIGDTVPLLATVSPTDTTDTDVSWWISDASLATVTKTGTNTASLYGKGSGYVTVYAKAGSITASKQFYFNKIYVSSISVNTADVGKTLQVGQSLQYTATLSPSNSTTRTASWSSGDSSIAKVDSNGKVTGIAAGRTTITARADNASYSFTVTVTASSSGTGSYNSGSSSSGSYSYSSTGSSTSSSWVNGVVLTPEDQAGSYEATYESKDFYQDSQGEVRCYCQDGSQVYNSFACDGTYTYYFQADGTAMTNRLTYHPDGQHVIYFDEEGHEVFSDFHHVTQSISGEEVDDYCFFDVNGYMYVDVLTYNKTGTQLLYANPYGRLECAGWFQFSETVSWADGTACSGVAGGYGYGQSSGYLLTNSFTYDWAGRRCYLQGNGVALY